MERRKSGRRGGGWVVGRGRRRDGGEWVGGWADQKETVRAAWKGGGKDAETAAWRELVMAACWGSLWGFGGVGGWVGWMGMRWAGWMGEILGAERWDDAAVGERAVWWAAVWVAKRGVRREMRWVGRVVTWKAEVWVACWGVSGVVQWVARLDSGEVDELDGI